MTISSTYSPAQFSGNSVAVAFAFTFKTFAAADLVVVLTSSAGVETTKTLTTHYSVSLNADQNNNPGGTVTMVTAPATGETLTIARELSAVQETDIANGGGFYPEVLEDALDRLTMLSQQNADILARSLRSSVAGGAVGDLPTVADRASKYLAFDASGDPVATSSAGSGPVTSVFMETVLDDTTAAAARTTLGAAASDVVSSAIGVTVQAYDADLTTLGAGGASARSFLGLAIGTDVQAYSANANRVVQEVEGTPYTTYSSVTTAIPVDDTIPQNTEGDQIVTASITPTNASNRLVIEASADMITGSAAIDATMALFQDSTANTLAATTEQFSGAAVFRGQYLRHEMAAGTTSATTFKIRMGPGSGTLYINGTSAGRKLGGVAAVRLRVTEIRV